MEEVKKMYKEAYEKYGNSVKSVFFPKGRQKERFDSLTKFIKPDDTASVLDYGCGLGHLLPYITEHYKTLSYEGCDIVDEFISENIKNYNYPGFFKIDSEKDVIRNYDYVLIAGVFNILYTDEVAEHKRIVFEQIGHLFNRTNKVLAINFMTDQIDFIGENAYHQNVMELYGHVRKHLTRRIAIDQSYMPFEFTIHLFKDQEIIRPDNIYAGL